MNEDPTLRAAELIYDTTFKGPLLRSESLDLAVKVMAEGYQQAITDLRDCPQIAPSDCETAAAYLAHLAKERTQ